MSQYSKIVSATGYMSTMNTLALMPPMQRMTPMATMTATAITFFFVLLAPGRRSLLMIVSAMEKAAPLSE